MADGLKQGLQGAASAAEKAESALSGLTGAMFSTGKGFDGIIASVETASDMFDGLGKMVGAGTSALLGQDNILNKVGSAFSGLSKVMTGSVKAYSNVIGALDSASAPTRHLQNEMFNLAAQFGGTFEEADAMAKGILSVSDELATAEFGFINTEELYKAQEAFRSSKIPIEEFGSFIESSAGKMDMLSNAILHSKALGMTVPEYFNKMSNAILQQGLSAQEGAEQLAMFGDIAENTGLTVDSISNSLQGLVGDFTKIGLTADFGRPLLEGFTTTLKDMGLGIGNATELAKTFGKSLAKLAEDYSMAYVVSQRGGLDFGAGGGALGASIGMQARILEADQTGDQAALGLEMAEAMKETLASFTGGDIVTIKEAAASPELETEFYMQQQILKDMFNMDQNSATRTLDYLSRLEEVSSSGDQDMVNSLGEQISQSITTRDRTMDNQDKLNAIANAQLAQLQLQSTTLFGILRSMSEDMIDLPADALKEAVGAFGGGEDYEALASSARETVAALTDSVRKNIGLETNEEEGRTVPRGTASVPVGFGGGTAGGGGPLESLLSSTEDLQKSVTLLINDLKRAISSAALVRGDGVLG